MKIVAPILILGYERSGTTLVRRLLSMCPVLEYEIVHEKCRLLLKAGAADKVIDRLTFPATQMKSRTGSTMSVLAGQKIPYVDFDMAHKVVKRFRGLFPESTIVHITRDPLWAINSQVKTFGMNPSECFKNYFASVPLVDAYLSDCVGVVHVRFENIVKSPEDWVTRIYSKMGWESRGDHIKRVVSTRDPWKCEFGGRVMAGLRYFDSVSNVDSKCVLSSGLIRKIKKKVKGLD